MSDEVRVKLTIASNELSGKDITALIGIEADQIQVRGEMNKVGTKPYAQHVWRIRSQHHLVSTEPLWQQMEGCISELLDRLRPSVPAIRKLSAENMVEVGIYVFARDVPSLGFSKEQVETIAALGASVDIDVVLYSKSETQPAG